MAYSNNFSHLLISTGNKSEISVGYSTIYGDMNGGFNVLKDVYKTELYKLANWRNNLNEKLFKGPSSKVIPENSITKPPSAELSLNQKDTDSLPPYEILDEILYYLIENNASYIKGKAGITATLLISKKDFSEITFAFPKSKIEQNQIAKILSDIDLELELLKQKLSKYQLAKQGMMQKLLTGKIRLV